MPTLKNYSVTKIGNHRGSPRIWLQGLDPSRAGFRPGDTIAVRRDLDRPLLTIVADDSGRHTVSRKAARSAKSEQPEYIPVIDINSRDILAMFDGLQSVRVVVQPGRITILPVASEMRARERVSRLRERIQAGERLETGSMASGIGILDRAAHEGLKASGLDAHLAFVNEVREDCIEHAVEHNPVIEPDTVLITAPMQEAVFDEWLQRQMPQLDLLVAGIPCSAASRSGRAKRGLAHPEDHPLVGHLVVAFLAMVARTNPAVVCLENVPIYAQTASMSIIRNQLADLGYEVHETVLKAAEWNMVEPRERLCMVAVTKGISFSFDGLEKPDPATPRVGDILDDVPLESPMWSSMDYLKDKRERDAAKGSNFKMNVVTPESTAVGCLNKTLWKRQSTGTFVQHPENPDLLRLPTVAEHARAKDVWPDMIEGAGFTFGHEVLGQSVSVPPWVAVFKLLGQRLKAFAQSKCDVLPFFSAEQIKVAA